VEGGEDDSLHLMCCLAVHILIFHAGLRGKWSAVKRKEGAGSGCRRGLVLYHGAFLDAGMGGYGRLLMLSLSIKS
jgi:hypothetical protein